MMLHLGYIVLLAASALLLVPLAVLCTECLAALLPPRRLNLDQAPVTRPRVAVLDDQHRVHYRDVKLGRDYGAEVQVLSGLKEGEQVVVHPGDDWPDGTVVDPVPLPTSKTGS